MPTPSRSMTYPHHFWDLLEALAQGKQVEIPLPTDAAARSFRVRCYAFARAVQRDHEDIVAGRSRLLPEWQPRVQEFYTTACNLTTLLRGRTVVVLSKHLTPEASLVQSAIAAAGQQARAAGPLPDLSPAKIEPPEWMKRLATYVLPDGTEVPYDDPRAVALRDGQGLV